MPPDAKKLPERRAAYRHFRAIPTRWMDNDLYGHVNNVVYYSYFDTVINAYLIDEGGLDIHNAEVIGIAVETMCRFRTSLAFPETIDAGLRVGHLGNSSVRYEVGLFKQGSDEAAAEGHFVHVFVKRGAQKPVGIPLQLRDVLHKIST
ncbi:MAG: acyl-CoA thioesterase [Proteobacteria bacterium]|nr:acyl-CoA thioesterase [Pseudomonadota bacterium]